MTKKFLLVGGEPESLINFRGSLIEELINKGYEVTINIGCFDNITKKETKLSFFLRK